MQTQTSKNPQNAVVDDIVYSYYHYSSSTDSNIKGAPFIQFTFANRARHLYVLAVVMHIIAHILESFEADTTKQKKTKEKEDCNTKDDSAASENIYYNQSNLFCQQSQAIDDGYDYCFEQLQRK